MQLRSMRDNEWNCKKIIDKHFNAMVSELRPLIGDLQADECLYITADIARRAGIVIAGTYRHLQDVNVLFAAMLEFTDGMRQVQTDPDYNEEGDN